MTDGKIKTITVARLLDNAFWVNYPILCYKEFLVNRHIESLLKPKRW